MQVLESMRSDNTRTTLPVKLAGDCGAKSPAEKTLVLVITTDKHRIEIEIGEEEEGGSGC
jgi:hypothetical protein